MCVCVCVYIYIYVYIYIHILNNAHVTSLLLMKQDIIEQKKCIKSDSLRNLVYTDVTDRTL